MAEDYLLQPEVKKLNQLRGMERISLSLRTKQVLAELDIERIAINTRGKKVDLLLASRAELTEEITTELEAAIGRLLKASCRIRLAGPSERRYYHPVQNWEIILEKIKKELPGISGWLSSAPPVLTDDGCLVLPVTTILAQEYLCRQEGKLRKFLLDLTGVEYRLQYEATEEELEELPLPASDAVVQEEISARVQELLAPSAKPVAGKPVDSRKSAEVLYGKRIKEEPRSLKEIQDEETGVVIEGRVFRAESRDLKSGKTMLIFDLTDQTDSITVKVFSRKKQDSFVDIAAGDYLRVKGEVRDDSYAKELVLIAQHIQRAAPPVLTDEAEVKRVELHLHTKMSAMDSTVNLEDAIRLASAWGHPAIAVTDHGVVQAFPDAAKLGKKYGIKIIYGMEGYLVNDGEPIVINPPAGGIYDHPIVVVDIETTGFNPQTEELLEIGAVRIEGGRVVGEFSELVRPNKKIPPRIIELTGITEAMVAEARGPGDILPEFMNFAAGAVFVAHNAQFDLGFLAGKIRTVLGVEYTPPVLDTLALSRALWSELKSHRLNVVAKELGIKQENHHRATDDARTTWRILQKAFELCQEKAITNWAELNSLCASIKPEQLKTYHILLLVRNMTGLKNLYRLVSEAHIKYFHRHPRLPRTLLQKYRDGLILGTACESGELFQAILDGVEEDKLRKIAEFYDFLEIQPLGNNGFLLREGRATQEQLMEFNRRICRLGEDLQKPVIATGDVHFLRPEDEIFRRILLAGQGYDDADHQPPVFLRTTTEMLAEFSYLPDDLRRQVVIENPLALVDAIEDIQPVPSAFCPPKIPDADQEIRKMSYERAEELYGRPLPTLVEERLELELKSIIGHGYAVLYLIAQKLVKKSLDDGYLVGSRGSVGSSFVATMCGITEVNPLPAHYRCANCLYSEFKETGAYGSGYDLPAKNCPHCGRPLIKDGQDIPFATFMGFEGDKEPDIDLNFSGEYQPIVHKYTEELFGKGYVFRAGTITGLAEKTAFGFIRGYMEERGIKLRQAEINRLVQGCSGVRRSTGQHPGGLIVVPQDQEIYNFSPIQYPANDRNAEWVTTHFDYHAALEGHLVKLDILGHDDPTVIRMLHDLTGFDPKTVPMDDPETMAIFSSAAPLGISGEDLDYDLGTLGIPEFGTAFVRQMLVETKPTTFSELLYISGLSHGTNVWLGNAEELIKEGQATLSQVISTRDNIMNDLIFRGVPPKTSFKIMEKVRKGRGLDEEDIKELQAHDIPQWYIDSCLKIKYLFPKAHAAAYVMMAFRIAYFKVHMPEAFYATYFTVRAYEFDADLVLKGEEYIRNYLREIQAKGNEASAREKNICTILEIVLEAMLRGIRFLPVDLYQSDAQKFLITENGLRPPLASLQGLGVSAARSLVQARQEQEFCSVEDLKTRARLSSAVIEVLKNHGCLAGLPECNQLTLF